MVRTLIITEKPSVAGDFAKALGVSDKRDGYIEGNGYAIAWAFGHLTELKEPHDYEDEYRDWNMDVLPILPEKVEYKALASGRKQLSTIGKLLKGDFSRVVIATDAGREGEVIARTILQACGFEDRRKLYRFWSSQALTPEVVRAGMEMLKPAADYDRLWEAGQARQIADWLVGINGTRAATLRWRGPVGSQTYSVGRVQTAVLSLLVDRKREREHFTSVPYWTVECGFKKNADAWRGTWFKVDETRFSSEKEARSILEKIGGKTGEVTEVKRERKKEPPPLLYSLTELQQDANRKHGFTAQRTLDLAQKLYEERKCLSYPRTDSRVLGSQCVTLAKEIIEKLTPGHTRLFAGVRAGLVTLANKRVFNDAKLTDHHALIPLAECPRDAGNDERTIWEMVLKRFAESFHADCEYESVEVVTTVECETFRTRGKTILLPGWREIHGSREDDEEDADEENVMVPLLAKGETCLAQDAGIGAGKTTPPPEYSEALLLKDMTNPSRYVEETEFKELFRGEIGLGTQATRAECIEKLVKRGYAERKKRTLLATDRGCFLVDSLRKCPMASALASARETASWEGQLEKIALGAETAVDFSENMRGFVKRMVEEIRMSEAPEHATGIIGQCPVCKGRVKEGGKGFYCENGKEENGAKCRFVVWKDIAGKNLAPEEGAALLDGKTIGPFKLTNREKKSFTANLALREENGQWKVRMVFDERKAIGKCPNCGAPVVENPKSYGCSKFKETGCKFVIWKEMSGKKITAKMAADILAGKCGVLKGFKSKSGNAFCARPKLERKEDGGHVVGFEFEQKQEQAV